MSRGPWETPTQRTEADADSAARLTGFELGIFQPVAIEVGQEPGRYEGNLTFASFAIIGSGHPAVRALPRQGRAPRRNVSAYSAPRRISACAVRREWRTSYPL
jgi:hypothetical protein